MFPKVGKIFGKIQILGDKTDATTFIRYLSPWLLLGRLLIYPSFHNILHKKWQSWSERQKDVYNRWSRHNGMALATVYWDVTFTAPAYVVSMSFLSRCPNKWLKRFPVLCGVAQRHDASNAATSSSEVTTLPPAQFSATSAPYTPATSVCRIYCIYRTPRSVPSATSYQQLLRPPHIGRNDMGIFTAFIATTGCSRAGATVGRTRHSR